MSDDLTPRDPRPERRGRRRWIPALVAVAVAVLLFVFLRRLLALRCPRVARAIRWGAATSCPSPTSWSAARPAPSPAKLSLPPPPGFSPLGDERRRDGDRDGDWATAAPPALPPVEGDHRCWTCETCTFAENPMNMLACSICDTLRPSVALEASEAR